MGPIDAVRAVWSLDPEVFRSAATGARFGVAVVLAAGLATAIGQSLALFAVGVRPRRFAASLVVQAALFAIGFLTWATSAWLVATLGFEATGTWRATVAATGLAHAPQLFGAFVLVPYFGTAIGGLLSVWTLLAVWIATAAVFDLSAAQALAASVGGWFLVQALQRTVGRPLTRLGRYVRRSVAGAELRPPRQSGR
ncbi:MAG: hypothetical protein P1P87_08145 [Trueperaceae bacterium]|nr:hypothetical protein [Trueperaceae bacterium]